jgi:pimeloyl-ACP methyl ester carboxylesterase
MRHISFSTVAALWAAAFLGAGPATAQAHRTPPGVIFVANGSGDSKTVTENLGLVLAGTPWPLCVRTINWTSYGGARRDHNYVTNHRKYGALMAAEVELLRKRCPEKRVYLMGHSSGTHVVLNAAECLPSGSIERIVLLAPSVSCTYDLRRAIKATRSGIDVYYSLADQVLDRAVDAIGTADGIRDVPAAGQVGFRRLPPNVPDAALYCLVRQYPYHPEVYAGTGHNGGHSGSVRVQFLRLVTIPNMLSLPH